MTDERHDRDFGAEESRALEAVRSLPRPEADPQFRARLREDFVAGSIASAPSSRETVRRAAPVPMSRWRRLAPVAVAAAAILLLIVPWARTPGLDLVGIEGTNSVVLNGEVVPCADLSPIQAALHPGCRLEVPEGATVQLARAGELVMDLEGVTFTFPGKPLPLLGRMASAIEGDGVVRVATAPGAFGSAYRLDVGDMRFFVRDTVFTVSRSGGEIGINVLEGELEAMMPDGTREMIGPHSGAMIRDGQFMPMEFDPDEGDRLRTLRERVVVG